jgi:hypothetical protein
MQSDAPSLSDRLRQCKPLRLLGCVRIVYGLACCVTGALCLPAGAGYLDAGCFATLGTQRPSIQPRPWLEVLLFRDEPSHEQAERFQITAESFQFATQDVAVLLGHELKCAFVVGWLPDSPGRCDAEGG